MAKEIIKGEIVGLRKLTNSRNGNPRYSVRLRKHERGLFQNFVEYKTATDAGFAYAIYDGYIGKFATATLSNHKTPVITNLEIDKS